MKLSIESKDVINMHLTVIIGSNGPNISSVIMSASRGGFSNTVGSINLKGCQLYLKQIEKTIHYALVCKVFKFRLELV